MHDSRTDVAVAAAVAALLVLDLLLVEQPSDGVVATAVAAVVLGLAFLLRRRTPLALPVVAGAVLLVQSLAGGRLTHMLGTALVGMAVSFSTGMQLPRRPALIGAGAFLVGAWSELLLTLPDVYPLVSDLVFTGIVVVGAPWLAGRALRERRLQTEALQELAAQLAVEREQTAHLAVVDERNRIAREMHDVVAHSVSLMVVQAGAGRRMLDTDPERSRAAMHAVEDAGRQALGELRRVLGLLRGSPEPVDLAPQPGIDQLAALVEGARSSGLPVDVAVTGSPRPLPPGLDLAVYRVVQEALTNAVKHAGPARARIGVCWEPDALAVEVLDDGRGGVPADGSGHGLVGMRERVAAYGGQLQVGPQSPRGFGVHLRVPLAASGGP